MNKKKRNSSSWKFIYYVSNEGDITPYELDSIGCHKTAFKRSSRRKKYDKNLNHLNKKIINTLLSKSKRNKNECQEENIQTSSYFHACQDNEKFIYATQFDQSIPNDKIKDTPYAKAVKLDSNENDQVKGQNNDEINEPDENNDDFQQEHNETEFSYEEFLHKC